MARYTIQEKAECVGTYRWIEIQLMEMLARWVPTTPEMEVKILLGRHVWDCAQHADAFGKRAFDLRAPLHYTLQPIPAYRALLRDVSELVATSDRLCAFYDVICLGLVDRYRGYIENVDPLMDEPTVRIIENILRDYERMVFERNRLTGKLPLGTPEILAGDWKARERAMGVVVAHGEPNRRARGVHA